MNRMETHLSRFSTCGSLAERVSLRSFSLSTMLETAKRRFLTLTPSRS
jgi:hypothetical protein